jgi:hypothetical protein
MLLKPSRARRQKRKACWHLCLGPIPNHGGVLARIFGCGNIKADVIVRRLIRLGKIETSDDGKFITQNRVMRELDKVGLLSGKNAINGSLGGKAKAKNRGAAGRASAECEPSDPPVNPKCGASAVEVRSKCGTGAKPIPEENQGSVLATATKSLLSNSNFSSDSSLPVERDSKGIDTLRDDLSADEDDTDIDHIQDSHIDEDGRDWSQEDGDSAPTWILEEEAKQRAAAQAAGQASISKAAIDPAPPISPWEPGYPEDPRDPDVKRRKQEQRAADAMMCAP